MRVEKKDIGLDLDNLTMKSTKVKKVIDIIDAENTGKNTKKKAKMCKSMVMKSKRGLTAANVTIGTSVITQVSLHPIKEALL